MSEHAIAMSELRESIHEARDSAAKAWKVSADCLLNGGPDVSGRLYEIFRLLVDLGNEVEEMRKS